MRAQGRGRIINISSVLGFIPAPYMAVYAATKHAIEGYSESVDHEVREHGVRVLLVEPAYTRTGFDANSPAARHAAAGLRAAAAGLRRGDGGGDGGGDDPATVAKVIVAAATDPKPKLRYTAGSMAGRVSACAASFPPGRSTGRSASSTACPPEARASRTPTRSDPTRPDHVSQVALRRARRGVRLARRRVGAALAGDGEVSAASSSASAGCPSRACRSCSRWGRGRWCAGASAVSRTSWRPSGRPRDRAWPRSAGPRPAQRRIAGPDSGCAPAALRRRR